MICSAAAERSGDAVLDQRIDSYSVTRLEINPKRRRHPDKSELCRRTPNCVTER